MRLLVVTRPSIVSTIKHSRSVCSRLLDPFAFLASHGMVEYDVLDERQAVNLEDAELSAYQGVFFSKHKSAVGLELIRRSNTLRVPSYYDVDEHVFKYPTYSSVSTSEGDAEVYKQYLRLSTHVIVSNERLIHELKAIVPRDYVFIPTGLDTPPALIRRDFSFSPLQILFVNGDTIKADRFRSDLMKFLQYISQNPERFKLTVISDEHFGELGPQVVQTGPLDWSDYRSYVCDARFHLAIIPLAGEEESENLVYNSCKTPIKFIEYAGHGIPGMYSDTPLYRDVITHGENGLLLKNSYPSWVQALDQLEQNRIQLENISVSGFRKVSALYSYDVISERYAQLLGIPT